MASQENTFVLPGYDVRRMIGGGGMGEVFEAVDTALSRTVAIKRLRRDRLDPEAPGWGTWNARFRREARMLAAINHPNIATVHNIVEHEGVLHLIMEYVEGRSLRDAVAPGPLELDLSLEIARQMACGLTAAHEAGVIHRDIKPDNIRINTRSVVKILDFGLARESDAAHEPGVTDSVATTTMHTQHGVFLGTPGYASPEQVLGEAIDQRTDIFSFGCVLFEMLSGRRPFEGRGRAGARAVLEQEPNWVLLPAGLPPALGDLLRSCLARDRTLRPASFAEVAPVLGPLSSAELKPAIPAPVPTVPNNLPREHTSFVGRQAEAREVTGLLRGSRLVTLTGLGGTGKSRLAVHVARTLCTGWRSESSSSPREEAVYFVAVSPRQNLGHLVHALAKAAGCREAQGKTLTEHLLERLAGRNVLVLVDGCEHSPKASREFIDLLLNADEAVRVLCTGRERLGLPGEAVYRVPMLALPRDSDPGRRRPLGIGAGIGAGVGVGVGVTLAGEPSGRGVGLPDAVALFVQRAARGGAWGFSDHSDQDLDRVVSICRRVGGMPLAIEIAAGFIEAVSVEELDDRMAEGLDVLSQPLDADPQERTIDSVLRWSMDRLEPREAVVLRRVSVFSGEFTLAAAEAVAADEGVGGACADGDERVLARDLLADLLSLVRRGLVVKTDPAHAAAHAVAPARAAVTRYRLLDPVRQYVAERAAAEVGGAEDLARGRSRHARYYLALVERFSTQLEGPNQAAAMAILSDEHREILAAMDAMTDTGEVLRLAVGMARFWYKAGFPSVGRQRLEAALERAGPEAAGTMPSAMAIRSRAFLGVLNWAEGRMETAERHYREALAMSHAAGDHVQIAAVSANLGLMLTQRGDLAGAEAAHEEALRASALAADPSLGDRARLHIGVLRMRMGAWDEARTILEDCLARYRSTGDQTRVARTLSKLGEIHRHEGRLEEAWAANVEAVEIALQGGDRPALTEILEQCTITAWQRGGRAQALRLLAIAKRIRSEDGSSPPPELAEQIAAIERSAVDSPEEAMVDDSSVDTLESVRREIMAIRRR